MWCVLRNLLRASLIFIAFLLHANPTYSQVVISEPPGIETGVRGIRRGHCGRVFQNCNSPRPPRSNTAAER